MSPKIFWQNVCKEMESYYGYSVDKFVHVFFSRKYSCFFLLIRYSTFSESFENLIEKTGLQKISVLRRFCIISGIQILLREYSLDGKQKPAFSEDDIVNLFPVVKHINPRVKMSFLKLKKVL